MLVSDQGTSQQTTHLLNKNHFSISVHEVLGHENAPDE